MPFTKGRTEDRLSLLGCTGDPLKALNCFSCFLISQSRIVSKMESKMAFSTFSAPYLLYRNRNNTSDELRNMYGARKMFRESSSNQLR